jgi:hypothetical protein
MPCDTEERTPGRNPPNLLVELIAHLVDVSLNPGKRSIQGADVYKNSAHRTKHVD